MNTPRESLVRRLDALTDAQVAALLQVVEAFEDTNGHGEGLAEYDESKDLTIAMFSGPTDLAERSEKIIYGQNEPE
jgi:hypothetical protein